MKIGDDIAYNLEFKLLPISERLNLSTNPKALDICSTKEPLAKAAAHSKMNSATLRP